MDLGAVADQSAHMANGKVAPKAGRITAAQLAHSSSVPVDAPPAGASSTDALSERWLTSPEALRARQYIAFAALAFVLVYGGGALIVLSFEAGAEAQGLKLSLGVALALIGLGMFVFSFARRAEARAKFY